MPDHSSLAGNSDIGRIIDALAANARNVGLSSQLGQRLRAEIDEQHRSEEMLRRSNQRLELVSEVASQLLMSSEPQKIIDGLCQKVLAFLDCHAFFNYLLDERGHCLRLNAVGGVPDEVVGRLASLELGVAVCGCVAQAGTRIVLENLGESDDPRGALVKSLGITAYACHPLLARGRVIGTLSFGSRTRRRFSPDDLSLMKVVSEHIAIAMERLLAQQELRVAKEQAERASRAKDQFLSTVSHELRTPLNAILGWTQLYHMGVLGEEERDEAFHKIEQNARSLAGIVEDVLDISRIINGRFKIDRKPVNLWQVIQGAMHSIRASADAKKIQVEGRLDLAAGHVIGDSQRLEQVMSNLLSNAVKFTPDGGRVEVRLEAEGETAVIRVTDTGKGIDAEFLPQLFSRFMQADSSSTRSYNGLGLGLAIVRSIVEAHGGTVSAASDGEQQGATFTVRLPRIVSAPEPAAPVDGAGAAAAMVLNGLKGMRVLAVDDEPSAREVLERVLRASGCEVKTAASASEAFESLRCWRPDVLVSDLAMPGEDGYSLVKRIRSLPPGEGGNTPAVALTAYASADDRSRALGAGFEAHLGKPANAGELVQTIRELSRRSAAR